MKILGDNLSFEYLGKEFETNKCGKCVVTDYSGSNNITIKFYHPEYITKCTLSSLRKGSVKNPLFPSVYGKGYIGVGMYNSRNVRVYHLWKAMLSRCYSEIRLKTRPTYKSAEVCEGWLNFQNFAEWCYSQKFFKVEDNSGKSYHLDKDILVKGNKVYSPETCCFVPHEINALVLKSAKTRGELPIGVSTNSWSEGFVAYINKGVKKLALGNFKTIEDAFSAYSGAKESYVKEIADKWRGQIDGRVYEALMSYKVGIDD